MYYLIISGSLESLQTNKLTNITGRKFNKVNLRVKGSEDQGLCPGGRGIDLSSPA